MIGNLIREAVSEQKNRISTSSINVEKKFILPLKRLLKDSHEKDILSEDIFKYLSMELNNKSGTVRLRALDLIDYFFTRSSAFRDVVARNLKNIAHSGGILRQSTGTNGSKAETFADQVQEKVKGMIELWDHLYGILYPSIHVMARFCRETMGLRMPNIVAQARTLVEDARRQELSQRNRIITMKDNIIRRELTFFMNQVSTSLKKIDECFEILFPGVVSQSGPEPTVVPFPSTTTTTTTTTSSASTSASSSAYSSSASSSSSSASSSTDNHNTNASSLADVVPVNDPEGAEFDNIQWDEEEEEEGSSSNVEFDMDSYRLDALTAGVPYTLEIPVATSIADLQNEDNEIILQTIRENVRFVTAFALPTLKQWQAALSKAGNALSEDRDGNPRKKPRRAASSESLSSIGQYEKLEPVAESKIADDIAEVQSAQRDIQHLLDLIEDKVLKKCKDLIGPSLTDNDTIHNHISYILDN